jgi:hypothetical protein
MKKLGIVLFLVLAALILMPNTADAHSGCDRVRQLSSGGSYYLKYYCYQVEAGPWWAPWDTTTTRTYRSEAVPYRSHSSWGPTDGCSIPASIEGIELDATQRSNLMFRFESACNEHDYCYSSTRSYATKSRCDNEFLYNMYFICDHVILQALGCYHEASVMYLAVAVSDEAQAAYDRHN